MVWSSDVCSSDLRHSARACDLCPCLPLPLVPDGNSHMGAVMLRETGVGEPRNMLVLGGARSGKSRYAQQCAETFAGELVFVATAQAFDDEMTERIERHQSDRGKRWRTIEEPLDRKSTRLNSSH